MAASLVPATTSTSVVLAPIIIGFFCPRIKKNVKGETENNNNNNSNNNNNNKSQSNAAP